MTTRAELHWQLTAMQIPQDVPVLVHSSLRAVGEVEGGGIGLLEVLIEYVTAKGGLLCIPTHTWANLKQPITLDLSDPATCIGTLPTLAARMASGVRTAHPTHSMKVFGESLRVDDFVRGEGESETPLPPDGCYGRLVREGGKVLLIGVGHNRNTFLHSVEEMLAVPNRLSEEVRRLSIRYPDGRLAERCMRIHHAEGIRDVSAFYPKYEPAFRAHGCIRDGVIGAAATQLCDAGGMRDVMDLVRQRSRGRELLSDDAPLPSELYSVSSSRT